MALTLAVFAYQVSLGPDVGSLIRRFGVVPARIAASSFASPRLLIAEATTVVSAIFIHGGYIHLFGNLLYLRVFGGRVEARLGHLPFVLVYLGAAGAGALAHVAADALDGSPMVGASGALSGVLGVYVVLFPMARITTLFPAVIALTFIELPALLFVGLWVIQQALNGYLVLAEGLGMRDIAWMAHLGGFGFGLFVGGLVRLKGGGRSTRRA